MQSTNRAVTVVKQNGKRKASLFPLFVKMKSRQKQARLVSAGLCFDSSFAWKEEALYPLQESPEMQADGVGHLRSIPLGCLAPRAHGIFFSLESEERESFLPSSQCHDLRRTYTSPLGEGYLQAFWLCADTHILPRFP